MWGVTMFDQLACRIAFKQLRYEGEFTPPTTTPSLLHPGYYGGMNWGSASVDEHNGLLIVNDALWHNLVADEADEADETIIIREALDAVTASESYTQALLPVGNGLLVAVKD